MMSQPPLPEKITQLQCASTNTYLQSQFIQWASESLKYKPQLLNYLQDEIEAIIGIAEYALTIKQDRPQSGDFLQNIQFSPILKTTKRLWLLLSVVLPYVLKKIKTFAAKRNNSQLWKGIESALMKMNSAINILEFLNYAVFILHGRYRSLLQRVLGIIMQFKDPDNKRILNFSLMNRVLVWKVYQFFLKNLLPQVFGFFQGPLKSVFYMSSYMQPEQGNSSQNCVFCSSTRPITPLKAVPCGHTACYYCQKQNNPEKCPSCSTAIEQWNPASK